MIENKSIKIIQSLRFISFEYINIRDIKIKSRYIMYSYKNSGLHLHKTTKAKNSSTGLRYLVNYHRICCVSYLGSQIDQNKYNYFLKFILILWNLDFLAYS